MTRVTGKVVHVQYTETRLLSDRRAEVTIRLDVPEAVMGLHRWDEVAVEVTRAHVEPEDDETEEDPQSMAGPSMITSADVVEGGEEDCP